MAKRCAACDQVTPIELFSNNKSKPDGKSSTCKFCMRKYRKKHYEENKTKIITDVSVRKKVLRDKIWELKSNVKCVDCGLQDPRVIDFDHLKDKEYNISKMAAKGLGWDKILKEIEKCEPVCANCHRIRTFTRGNWKVL